MGSHGGPKIATDGLVFLMDTANKKSYPGSGTAWNDLSGNAINGTLTNGPVFSSDNVGIIDFDGSNDYIQLQSNGTGTFNNQIFSLGMWFKVDSLASYNVLFSYDYTAHSAPHYATHLRLETSGAIRFHWNNGSANRSMFTGAGVIVADTWYNIYITFKSGKQQLFINGTVIHSTTLADTITFYNQEVWIGRSNFSSGYTNGKITLFNYYNRELSAAEVVQNYNATKSRFGL
jgi:hypothetical protein